MKGVVLAVFLTAGATLYAQVGYPGGYPGPGGSGIPLPRKGKRGTSGPNNPAQKVIRVTGTLTSIDAKQIVVDVPDGRTVEFLRNAKTKVFREDEEAKASDLKVGDQIAVGGTEDQEGVLTAETIRIEESAPASAGQPESGAATRAPSATSSAPAPVRDPGDPGPPTTKRGVPAPRASQPSGTSEEIAEVEDSAEPEIEPAVNDPLIEKARGAAATFSDGLPAFLCKQFMARFMSSTRPADWRALDIVSAEVLYRDGKETYRNVTINGKATKKEIDQIGGSWSTGEFASMLLDLFSSSTAAEFYQRGNDEVGGARTRVYNFTVQQPNSHWFVKGASQSIKPAYRGAVWIDPGTGRVRRIEMAARSLPEDYPFDTVESAVDYGMVRLGEREYLLPVHAESLSCQRGSSYCSRNTIDFRNYHKFDADSNITFTPEKK